MTTSCDYGKFNQYLGCADEAAVKFSLYVQIAAENYAKIPNFEDCSAKCSFTDLKMAYVKQECLPSCFSPECGYALGLCPSQLSEKCEVGWGPGNNQCLQCRPPYKQYFGTCIETCPRGLEPYWLFPHLCIPKTDSSSLQRPDVLYVLEDITKTTYHEGDLYFNLMDALAAVWAKYTVIYLLGEKVTYRVNYMYSHLDNVDYITHKQLSDLTTDVDWTFLKMQSLPCSAQPFAGCYQGTTTLQIHPSPTTLLRGKTLVFQDVKLTSRQLFANSAFGYCPWLTETAFGYVDERGEPVNYVRKELFQCSNYEAISLFQVNFGAELRLLDVVVQDFTIQLKALVLLEGGNATLSNVTFSNIQPGTSKSPQAIILSVHTCNPFDFCGSLTYQVGKVEYLNNGYELSIENRLSPFIRLHAVTSILIEDIVFQYNTLITTFDMLGLLTVDHFLSFSVSRCLVHSNFLIANFIDLWPSLTLPTSVRNDPVWSTTSHITLSHVTIRNTLAEKHFINIVMEDVLLNVLIENCEFYGNALKDGAFLHIEFTGLLTERVVYGTRTAVIVLHPNFVSILRTSFVGLSSYVNAVSLVQVANIQLIDLVFLENGHSNNMVQDVIRKFINTEGIYAKVTPEFASAQCQNMLQITNCVNSISRNITISSNNCDTGGTCLAYSSCQGSHSLWDLTVFNNTSGGGYGAGLALTAVTDVVVTNLKATSNTGVSRGVIFISGAELILKDSILQDNSCSIGAAIYASEGISLIITNTVFRRNSAPISEGGAIYFNSRSKPSGVLIIRTCTFEANTAKSASALSLQLPTGGEALYFSITDSTFAYNYATLGSSLATSSTVVLEDGSYIFNCTFKHESSNLGVLSFTHIAGILVILDTLFEDCYGKRISVLNLQTGDEAGLYMQAVTVKRSKGSVVIHKANALLNSVLITNECLFLHNDVIILFFESGYWEDTGSVFQFNTATAAFMKLSSESDLNNTRFESNNCSELAASYYGAESSLKCTGCVFRNNTAANGSGPIIDQTSQVTLRNCLFERNTATDRVSTIFATGTEDTPTYIYNTVFRYNTGSAGLIVLLNAQLYLESVLIEYNAASDSPCISALQSTLTANNVTFRYQTGTEVPFLSIDSGCAVTLTNSRLYEGSAQSSGALMLSNSSLTVINSTFYALRGSESALLWTQGANTIVFESVIAYNLRSELKSSVLFAAFSELTITNCSFSDFEQGAVAGTSLVFLIINNSAFIFGVSRAGAGLICEKCERIEIHASRFEHLKATYGGALSLTGCTKVTVSHTVFKANQGDRGGGLYAEDSMLRLSDSAFYENWARETNGGGLDLACPNLENCAYQVTNTVLEGNRAKIAGGALAWQHSKPELINVTTANNSAYYGPNYASFPTHLQIRSSRLLQSELMIIPPGQPAGVTISAALVDHYNQTVLIDNNSIASLEHNGSLGIVSGEYRVPAVKGIFTFSNFYVYAQPQKKVTLIITTTGIPKALDSTAYNQTVAISAYLRACIPGESTADYSCNLCAKGTYGFDPSQPCQNCLANAQCLGTFQMYPNAGYWRSGMYSEKIWVCPVPHSCLGGDPFGNNTRSWTGYCREGYAGNMCQSCAWGFSRAGKDRCQKCSSLSTNIVRIIFMVIAMVAYNIYQIWSVLREATKPAAIHSIYLKILTNYLQLVFLVTEFRLSWPQPVLELFSAQENSGGIAEQLYSIDCFLSANGDSSKVYFKKMIFMAALPVVIAAAIALFWVLIASRNKELRYLKRELTASLVIAFFFIHPTLTKALFSMFSCTEINSEEYWLTIDLAIPCYDSQHYLYLFAVGIPAIVVWVFAMPLLCLCILIRNRRNLDELWMKLQYGFLIKGFSHKRFYWEFVVVFRKIAVICCSVFFTNSISIQALTVQALLIGFFLLQLKIRPYTQDELNFAELTAILVANFTIYSGLYYLSESLSEGGSWFFFVLIVSANMIFLFYWVLGFLRHMEDSVILAIPWFGRLLKPHIFEQDTYIEAFIEEMPAFSHSYVLFHNILEVKQLYCCLLHSPFIHSTLIRKRRPHPSKQVLYPSNAPRLSERRLNSENFDD